jgi:hypothetical protein
MKRSKFTDEQILAIVKESAGRQVADLCRVRGVTAQTWKATHGGTQLSDALSQPQMTLATSQRLYRTRGRSSRGSQIVVEASWMPRERPLTDQHHLNLPIRELPIVLLQHRQVRWWNLQAGAAGPFPLPPIP